MRVAILSRSVHPLHPPGGMERAVFHLATHLRAAGVETILLTRPRTEPAGAFPGDVLEIPYGPPGAAHGRILDRTLRYPRFSERLGDAVASLVRAGRVDVVDAQGLTALGYGRRRARDHTLRAPLVMNPQGMEEHKAQGLKRIALTRLRLLSREAARHADRVVATDEAMRDEVPRLLGVDPSRVVVLPNGIDDDEIRRVTPPEPRSVVHAAFPALREAFPVFLSVGRIEGYKGFGDTLRALVRVAATLPRQWAWVVVGEGPQAAGLVREAAASYERDEDGAVGASIAAHVHVVGRVEETLLHALYERADVFVHATRFEGSSLVTLEAMAHELPVVATRVGGIPDKVSTDSGRLVESGDIAALGRAVVEMSGDAALRQALGRSGRERVLRDFSWPTLARRTIALYETLLEMPRP
ncbi:MAG: glycosyltransferase family 4 protein [Vicinamibacteria bacterium]